MTIYKVIINHMKEMKNNLKGYIQKIMDQNKQRINKTMEKIFNNFMKTKKTRKGSRRNKSSQAFLNKKFEGLKTNVDEINSLNVDAKLQIYDEINSLNTDAN